MESRWSWALLAPLFAPTALADEFFSLYWYELTMDSTVVERNDTGREDPTVNSEIGRRIGGGHHDR